MTKLFEKALEAVKVLDPQEQDAIARVMLAMSKGHDPEPIEPGHLEAVLEGLSQARDGKLASQDQVAAAFKRFGA